VSPGSVEARPLAAQSVTAQSDEAQSDERRQLVAARPEEAQSMAARSERVARLLVVARRIADAGDPLGVRAHRGLLETSGLSRAGVELALTEHLETRATEAEMATLLRRSGHARRCHVVLSANVCTGALRAIAVATAAAAEVIVRPSRRDPTLASILVDELGSDPAFAAAGGAIRVAGRLEKGGADAPAPGDRVDVYGRSVTIDAVRAALAPEIALAGYGGGLGVAVIEADDDLGRVAAALARDVVPFDQRGCLSPRLAVAVGDDERGLDLARALHVALGSLGERVPRGLLDPDTARALSLHRATAEALGVYLEGPGHAVSTAPGARGPLLPPPARVVHVLTVSVPEAARELLGPWAGGLTALGARCDEGEIGGPLARVVSGMAPRARVTRLGAMQRPPLDGPVDCRLDDAVAADPSWLWYGADPDLGEHSSDR
jgi:hypothetical protein